MLFPSLTGSKLCNPLQVDCSREGDRPPHAAAIAVASPAAVVV